ncbi:MAG: hypothetical protein JXA99_04615 [Candidatus Lokiarchaeota archaeon]|nr:hypothetical protein [Candidatus Lokiarchaeota archaeon]
MRKEKIERNLQLFTINKYSGNLEELFDKFVVHLELCKIQTFIGGGDTNVWSNILIITEVGLRESISSSFMIDTYGAKNTFKLSFSLNDNTIVINYSFNVGSFFTKEFATRLKPYIILSYRKALKDLL